VIFGSHFVIFSTDAAADRDFFRDVLEFPFIDAGHDWLIFKAPPAEVALHPSETGEGGDFFLLCDDLSEEMTRLRTKGVDFSDVTEERWGKVVNIRLPSGREIGLYQPKHESPLR